MSDHKSDCPSYPYSALYTMPCVCSNLVEYDIQKTDDKDYNSGILFLLLHKNICCWYSVQAPCRVTSNEYPHYMFFNEKGGTSNEYPQHTFLWRN